MFKDKYMKDNDLIKPDDAFLERLKYSVAQEEKLIHIGDFVDYENAEQFDSLEGVQRDSKTSTDEVHDNWKWKKIVAVAACFAIVLASAIVAGNNNLFGDNNLQADMGKFVSGELEYEKQTAYQLDEEYIKMYNQVVDWFANSNAIIYEMHDYQPGTEKMKELSESRRQWQKLETQEREDIISSITLNRYLLTDVADGWDSVIYYIAEFDNQSYVVFGICDKQYIYIEEVSGLQSMATR